MVGRAGVVELIGHVTTRKSDCEMPHLNKPCWHKKELKYEK
jgi:hypothetical protein